MSEQEAKIIKLPVRTNSINQPIQDTHKPKMGDEGQKRVKKNVVLAFSIGAIVLAVTMANNRLFDSDFNSIASFESKGSRTIASVESHDYPMRDTQWEHEILQNPKKIANRNPSSIGTSLSAEEKLQFGFLEGKYAVNMSHGKIESLRFVAQSESPKYMNDRSEFFNKYQDLFGNGIETSKLEERKESGKNITEVYRLIDSNGNVSKVTIELDLHDRLLSLAVLE